MNNRASARQVFRIIGGRTVAKILGDTPRVKELVRRAYILHGEGRSVNPPSSFLRFPDKPNSRIIALPAWLGGEIDRAGLKWIASFPDNRKRGLPRASAVLILNDTETGYPLACIESSIVSAARTAASAVLGAELLSGGQSACRRLGLIGNGLIARTIYRHLVGNGWTIGEVLLHDRERAEAERFVVHVDAARHRAVTVCDTPEEVLTRCDLIVLATVALKPHIHDPALLAHRPLVLHISLRDLGADIIRGARNITDDIAHAVRENTSLHLAEQAAGNREFLDGTLYDVITGAVRVPRDRPAIFSPFGLGVLDLALGQFVYEQAIARGEDVILDDFFTQEGSL